VDTNSSTHPANVEYVPHDRSLSAWYARGSLRCFDHIRFFPVSAKDLLEIRDASHMAHIDTDRTTQFTLRAYHAFLALSLPRLPSSSTRSTWLSWQERERWATAGPAAFINRRRRCRSSAGSTAGGCAASARTGDCQRLAHSCGGG